MAIKMMEMDATPLAINKNYTNVLKIAFLIVHILVGMANMNQIMENYAMMEISQIKMVVTLYVR